MIRLLAERTGMDEERVDRQIAELTNHIRQVETGRDPVRIEGFGTFRTVQDRLEFIPSEVLSTEINNKYAGMKPIELIGAFKEPDGTDVPVAGRPDEAEVQESLEKEIEAPELNGNGSDSPEEETPEAEPVPPAEVSSGAPPEEKPGDRDPGGRKEETQDEDGVDSAEPPVSTAPAAVKADNGTQETTESLDNDPLGKAIVILAVILTLSVAGWLAYDFGLFGSAGAGSDSSPASSGMPAEQQRMEQENAGSSGEQTSGEEVENTQPAEQPPEPPGGEGNETPASTVETEPYGLYGEFNEDVDTGFFTIVVHSLRTMELAEEKKQGLVAEGFRTRIKETDVSGSTYYRVGIGQFSTIGAAQEAVRELPEPYQNNNFINRF
ncbi:SPOR domain-containing protein [Fodinibius roseus]|uniref:SPOR domain-containing protein n=1 Tax=Fodinibius roseus TaxID=1194090 RepID=UPI00147A7D2A|nr:SPOR domain-containing protein [Fodinibius roseus]